MTLRTIRPTAATLDPLSLEFAIYAQAQRAEVVQIGCRQIAPVLAVLERGGRVLAIDADPAALAHLVERVPPYQRTRLRTQSGLLAGDEHSPGCFAAARIDHALDSLSGASIERTLTTLCRCLLPGGKAFITAASNQTCIHLMDAEMLRQQIELAGFDILETGAPSLRDESGASGACAFIAKRPVEDRLNDSEAQLRATLATVYRRLSVWTPVAVNALLCIS
jgi:hypothetical protein